MMGAVQPFLSGAISKTINMPSDTTPRPKSSWMRSCSRPGSSGLKAVAIYRDGCKRTQPLNTSRTTDSTAETESGTTDTTAATPVEAATEQAAVAAAPAEATAVRRRLPAGLPSRIRHKFDVAGHEGYIHVGMFEDGSPGELFIKIAKEGSTIAGLMDTIGILSSMALQYGVPLDVLVNKFSHVRFEPSGFTKNPEIPIAKSLIDYVFRFLGSKFLDSEKKAAAGIHSQQSEDIADQVVSAVGDAAVDALGFSPQSDAPSCADCGAIMVRNGSCYKCLNCGTTSGCS